MKNKILLLIIALMFIIVSGCQTNETIMHIECEEKIIIQGEVELKVYYNNELLDNEDLEWTLSDYTVVSINNGILKALDYGKVTIGVIDTKNPTHYCAKEIEVIPPYVTDIEITGENELMINKHITLTAKYYLKLLKVLLFGKVVMKK